MKLHTFVATLLISVGTTLAVVAQKPPITAADQLPRRTDHVNGTVRELLADKPQLDRPARTVQASKFHASMFRDAVDYLRKLGVRIVNVSWRYTVATIEASLASTNIGKDELLALAPALVGRARR